MAKTDAGGVAGAATHHRFSSYGLVLSIPDFGLGSSVHLVVSMVDLTDVSLILLLLLHMTFC